ncbi:MAG TPA: LysM domain-containing protein [Chloroflexota bacterium]|nr:LysM domain-containing protein [Chloroflexota bacterium]
MLTRRVLRPLPEMPAMHEIERDHSLSRIGLFLCFCLSAVAFSMAVAKLPVRQLASIPQLQSLGALTHGLAGSTPATSASPKPITAPSAIVLASPSAGAGAEQATVLTAGPSTAAPAPASLAAAANETASVPASAAPASVPAAAPASAPASTPASVKPSAASPSPKPQASAGAKASYTVQAGDTLFAIARRNGISLEALTTANGMPASATLKVGQKLEIPA